MSSELPDLYRVIRLSEFGVSRLANNVDVLQYVRDHANIRRALTVLKTRASRHRLRFASSQSPTRASLGAPIGGAAASD